MGRSLVARARARRSPSLSVHRRVLASLATCSSSQAVPEERPCSASARAATIRNSAESSLSSRRRQSTSELHCLARCLGKRPPGHGSNVARRVYGAFDQQPQRLCRQIAASCPRASMASRRFCSLGSEAIFAKVFTAGAIASPETRPRASKAASRSARSAAPRPLASNGTTSLPSRSL